MAIDPGTAMVISGGLQAATGLFGSKPKQQSPMAQPLDPNLAMYGGQMANIGMGAFGELQGMMGNGFDGAYQSFYNKMAQANQPMRDQQILGLENRLFQQGRLGSTGGAFQQQADAQAYEQALMNQALQGTTAYQKQLAQMGEGMFSSLAPYKGIADPTQIDPLTGGYSEQATTDMGAELAASLAQQEQQSAYDKAYQQAVQFGDEASFLSRSPNAANFGG